ncbi:MAG TPA: 4,5-DOPA dioxygenase extradiol [Bacteroidia bacterium]|nr:4,5-DOPA dioxygenase extradiol [Bacteroidia bacterium]
MKLNELGKLSAQLQASEKFPALFLGHGSPMNAIEENEFVRGFRAIGKDIPKPRAVLVISAHWETRGTFVTAMEHPETIHDFGGFPKALFDVQYPAPGSPELAKETQVLVKKTQVEADYKWGIDHGSWSVVKHLYPAADVPVIQMSIDYTRDALYHYELAKELSALRRKGVLIIGSGNMVHNLGMIAWDKLNSDNYGYDWALEASEKMKQYILQGNHNALIKYRQQGRSWDLSIPSPEHYLPLLYILALQEKGESPELYNDKAVAGSLTMTSVKIA